MSEKWWTVWRECYGKEFFVSIFPEKIPDSELAKNERQEQVELRPLHQDPCEWEKNRRSLAKINGTWVLFLDEPGDGGECELKYCPMCGRKLD